MAKEYKLEIVTVVGSDEPSIEGQLPIVVRVDSGVSWREVKKQLRQWYLNEAAQLRSLRERDIGALVTSVQFDANGNSTEIAPAGALSKATIPF